MQPTLWFQSIAIAWRPELRFFETKLRILRQCEEQGIVDAFVVREDSIRVRMTNKGHEMLVGSDRLSLEGNSTEVDRKLLLGAADIALREIQPTEPTRLTTSFQHVYPLASDYDKAREGSLRKLLGDFSKEYGTLDYAMLVNGRSRSRRFSYQLEFGIISRSEVPARLARRAGRVSAGPREAKGLPPSFRAEEFAEASLFCDSTWQWTAKLTGEILSDSIAQSWEAAEREATEVAEELRRRFTAEDAEGEL